MSARPEERLAARGGAVELLRLPALLFGAAARLRGSLYDRRVLPSASVDVPVVCVGNLTAGGTGKTPLVAWVVRHLLRRGTRAGVLSRGYGARGGPNDEARELARLFPDVPHVQERDRVAGAARLVELGVEAVVLDDGFQHRRLARDLDLVAVDATRPWGLPAPRDGARPVRAFLPRGLLREGPEALARAGGVVLTRADQVSPAALAALADEVREHAPGVALAEAVHRPVRLRGADGAREPAELAGREVDLVSGIGNPDAFERTVRELGARVREHRRFPDHHAYGPRDLAGLGAGGRALVTTAKDGVKLAREDALVLEVELFVRRGAPALEALLDALRPGSRERQRAALHEGLHG